MRKFDEGEGHYIKTCDSCSKRIKESARGDIHRATIEAEDGYMSPEIGEGGLVEMTKIDICYECFNEKVKPLIEKELNIQFTSFEYD